jgi:hypothetical protein
MVVHACNPSTGRWRREDLEFKVTLSHGKKTTAKLTPKQHLKK